MPSDGISTRAPSSMLPVAVLLTVPVMTPTSAARAKGTASVNETKTNASRRARRHDLNTQEGLKHWRDGCMVIGERNTLPFGHASARVVSNGDRAAPNDNPARGVARLNS